MNVTKIKLLLISIGVFILFLLEKFQTLNTWEKILSILMLLSIIYEFYMVIKND